MKPSNTSPGSVLFFLLFISLFTSCKDDDNPTPAANGPESEINNWIYNTMTDVYYWTDFIPENPDRSQAPANFFYDLLYQDDQFSVIVPNYNELIKSLNGIQKEAGYEFILSKVTGSESDLVMIILYVKEGSPADDAGLKRGDLIDKVNNTAITTSNFSAIVDAVSDDHRITYRRYNPETEEYEDRPEIHLQTLELAENPHFLDTVYTINGHKIGYYVYNFFSDGEEGAQYDEQMDQIFADFKSKGVTDFVLDLRYNSGGAVASAANLASLLGRNIDSSEIFYENRWNDTYQEYWESQPNGEDILKGKFLEKPENIGDNLLSGRVYVLTGYRTASASELVINGLKPYMDVYLIGERTIGKNVGSIPIEDTENPANEYGMLPIVLKTFNSNGKSDYDDGFIPDDQMDGLQLPVPALGSLEEPLLARAVQLITGVTSRISTEGAQDRKQYTEYTVTPLSASIDTKLRTNRMIFENPFKKQ